MTDDLDSLPDEPGEDERLRTLRNLADSLHVDTKVDEIDSEFEDRLSAFDQRLADRKAVQAARKIDSDRQLKGDRDAAKGLGLGLTIAYSILGVPLVGYGIGFFVDQSRGTSTAAGIGMLIGALLGISVAVFMLGRQK